MYLLMSSHSSFWIQSTCWASFFIFLLSYNRNYLGLGLSCKWIFCYHYFRSLYHWCLPSLICWLHYKTYSDIFFWKFPSLKGKILRFSMTNPEIGQVPYSTTMCHQSHISIPSEKHIWFHIFFCWKPYLLILLTFLEFIKTCIFFT